MSGGGEARGSRGGAGGEGGGQGAEGAGGGNGRGGAHLVCGLKVGTLGDEVLEAVELASISRQHEGRPAVLRRRGGGATRGERRRRGAGAAGAAGGEGGGRGAEGPVGGGWRGGAHLAFGLEVHPLLHEALEGGEVAIPRRSEKSLLRLHIAVIGTAIIDRLIAYSSGKYRTRNHRSYGQGQGQGKG